MVNLGVRRVEDDVAAKHPSPGLRRVRGSRCCPHGGAAGTPRSTSAAPAAGSLGSYVVTRAETQKCSNFWIYLETGKSPQELAMTDGVSQPAENLPSAEDRDGAATLVRRNRYGDVME
ncbi:transmembrane protein 141 isoform X5 [Motacilla alba alba]|uniref:transmembrane protein 141 isoform X5 n=1 Tax=Motacilla alba alba TaxID=1094192 RepID=UPI0018D58A68|nr:transmembrane protein 141 isoform X5 [Motacilla alba alba]